MTSAQTSKILDSIGEPRLADFIRQNIDLIVAEWTAFARTRTPASDGMTKLALEDHIREILKHIADDLASPQSKAEQFDKSRGLGPHNSAFAQSAAEVHAELRLADGFDIDQMVSEYRALRASVVKQWGKNAKTFTQQDVEDLTRFNESIDQALSESVAHYTKSINHTRNLFLGVLGHDLRNPIGAATMAAQIVGRMASTDEKQTMLVSQIVNSTQRATHILNDLLDITRSSLGIEIPVAKAAMSMGDLAKQIVEEARVISHARRIEIDIVGETDGSWDQARMGQVLSNLLGNAVQYSIEGSTIFVIVSGKDNEVVISVKNEGDPIAPEKMKSIFKSLTRGFDGQEREGTTNLGLGLFIAKKIVEAHKGRLEVSSSTEAGTMFTISLPRR